MPSGPMTPKQQLAYFQLHSFLTGLQPLQGRDFTIDVEFDGDSTRYALRMQPITELGKWWVDYCTKELMKHVKQSPVDAGSAQGARGVHAPQPDAGCGDVSRGHDTAGGGTGATPGTGKD